MAAGKKPGRCQALEAMLATIPKHKGTEKLQADRGAPLGQDAHPSGGKLAGGCRLMFYSAGLSLSCARWQKIWLLPE